MNKLYIGFKGKNNASCILVQSLSKNIYLLTNSFGGLKKDIELLDPDYDCIIMFGIDKNLKDTIRIEKAAQDDKGMKLFSALNLEDISERFNAVGITNALSDRPTHYLCNEAYWLILQKYNKKAVFIHIPSIRNIDKIFIEKIKQAFD